eukprot:CAMPEP_0205830522 /NCGR_PEP_ID=MMETSP0206-20130828/41285_1 /ASSEMBLY_ACC=CAM_ASM_000279 /TAXON_ID=36767 /ORGANISM="Euplotes focardii, Strain TN1" /LENGTH=48 /DNA_ID= /DNA_START= /DNA_END= /DNA_ORIENTATION=
MAKVSPEKEAQVLKDMLFRGRAWPELNVSIDVVNLAATVEARLTKGPR